MSVSGVNTKDSEYDVYVYGNGSTIIEYFAYNSDDFIKEDKSPIKYHTFSPSGSEVNLGVCLLDTFKNDSVPRGLSVRINSIQGCKYTHFSSVNTNSYNADADILLDADYDGFVEKSNNSFTKLSNIKTGVGNNTLNCLAKILYGFDIEGNCMPIVSQDSSIPILNPYSKVYQPFGFDFHRGIYYADGYNGSLKYVEGNIYEEYSGVKIQYTDILNNPNVEKPVYIKGTLNNGLFYVDGSTGSCLTQNINSNDDNEEYVYWMVGYLQQNSLNGVLLLDLLTINNLYEKVGNTIKNITTGVNLTFTPTGTISDLTFTGTPATISVSGITEGTLADSSVEINPAYIDISTITNVGSAATHIYTEATEEITFNDSSLPTIENVSVISEIESATAKAQVFTGSAVTFTGSYTPDGSISTPEFTGDPINIKI